MLSVSVRVPAIGDSPLARQNITGFPRSGAGVSRDLRPAAECRAPAPPLARGSRDPAQGVPAEAAGEAERDQAHRADEPGRMGFPDQPTGERAEKRRAIDADAVETGAPGERPGIGVLAD